ncbi:VOC family protein [Lysobacter changpingensis]|uniref:VOC family protein n=1 Tax=Lysobacter changpingensis TaxID=2792784 RepID=UPI001A906F3B|nr:VOC family protein [Lysobacter changpingensis]
MQIRLTSVLVDDQAHALDFYTRVLGFQLDKDMPAGGARWLTVTSPEGAAGVELLLEPNGMDFAREFQRQLYERGIPATAFFSADIQAEYERLVERGVRFKAPPAEMGPAIVAQFDDTCGNWIQLVQVPAGD